MKVIKLLAEIPSHTSAVLTMGNFDGVHIGHQYLLSHVKKLATSAMTTVLTFENHPLEVINPSAKPLLITTSAHKLLLLEKFGVDLVLLMRFTLEIASQTYEEFLQKLSSHLHFSHLVLGEGAAFGKKKQGTQKNVEALSRSLQFEANYLPPYSAKGENVSSGRIRKLIAQGDLKETSSLLGRPYSLYLTFDGNGCALDAAGLQLPPTGTYTVSIPETKRSAKLQVLASAPFIKLDQATVPSTPLEVIFS